MSKINTIYGKVLYYEKLIKKSNRSNDVDDDVKDVISNYHARTYNTINHNINIY